MITEAKHSHWWVIATAQGPTSPGVCQTCGATGLFRNDGGISDDDWIQRVSVANRRRAKMRYAKQPGQGEEASWSE